MKNTTRVKICCISFVDEARTAIAHGASALGLFSACSSVRTDDRLDSKELAGFFTALR